MCLQVLQLIWPLICQFALVWKLACCMAGRGCLRTAYVKSLVNLCLFVKVAATSKPPLEIGKCFLEWE